MQSNTHVLEVLQTTAGTISMGNMIFNSSGTLPFLFAEFQKIRKVSDECGTIIDSIKCEDGTSILVSAVSDARKKYDNELSSLKQKICKALSDGFDDGDRFVFASLDEKTQSALRPLVAGDEVLRHALLEKQKQNNKAIGEQLPP